MEEKLQFIKWKNQYDGKNVGKGDSIQWNGKRYLPGTVFLFNDWALGSDAYYYKYLSDYYPEDPNTESGRSKVAKRIHTYIKSCYYEYAGQMHNHEGRKSYVFKSLMYGYVPDNEYKYYKDTDIMMLGRENAQLYSFTENELKTFKKAREILVNEGERALRNSDLSWCYICVRDIMPKYGGRITIYADEMGGKIKEVITPVEYNKEDYPIVYGYNQFTVVGWAIYLLLMLLAVPFTDKVRLWIMWTVIWGAIRVWQIFKISGR